MEGGGTDPKARRQRRARRKSEKPMVVRGLAPCSIYCGADCLSVEVSSNREGDRTYPKAHKQRSTAET